MKEHNENFYSLEELKRERDCYEGYKDGEEVFYFVGALRYACDEIERLNKKSEILEENNKLLIQQKSQLYEDLDVAYDRIDKAIGYLKSKEWAIDYEKSSCRTHLLEILKGGD